MTPLVTSNRFLSKYQKEGYTMRKVMVFIAIAFLCVVANSQEKRSVLPAYIPKNIVDVEVQKFLDDNSENSEKRIVPRRYDLLGRYSKDSLGYYIKKKTASKMKVVVTDLKHRDHEGPTMNVRYRIDKIGNIRLWLNDEEISTQEYEEFVSKLPRKNFTPPSYVTYLTAEEIEELLEREFPVWVSAYKEPVSQMVYSDILAYSQITDYAFPNNFNGNGIGVYFTETGCPNLTNINTNYYVQGNMCVNGERAHPTGVTRVLQVTAPQATIYGYDQVNYPNPDLPTPKIEIGSHSWANCFDSVYCSEDAAMDKYIYDYRVIVFVAAGNKNDSIPQYWVSSPGKALNAITVGAVDPTTNMYKDYSMWINSEIKNQKPEMANYTDFLFPYDYTFTDNYGDTYNGFFDGTSAATPFSAAIAADLLQQYSFFKRHPELYKAWVLAGEKANISNAFTHDQDNNSVGASALTRFSSMAWNHRGGMWSGANSCCFNNEGKIVFTESDISSGTHYRIAIAWLTSDSYLSTYKTIAQDIDLRVYQNGNIIASSLSGDNPFEVVDFVTTSNADLTIEIKRYSNSGSDNVVLGYSLWNDF